MERVTFPDPRVKATLATIERVGLDIDDATNAALRARYGDSAVPSFVMIDGSGNVVHRWVGGRDAAEFVAELEQGIAAGSDPAQRAERAAFDRMLAALTHGDDAAFALGAADLLALHADAPPADEATLWSCCERANERHDWPALRAAAARYLALANAVHHDDAAVLGGVAEFGITGKITPALQQRIDALIQVLDVPFPGSTLGDRVRGLLGDKRAVSEAEADAWVDRANASMEELGRIGAAAAPALLQAMRTRPGAAYDCATVLGRLQLPTTTDTLRAELATGKLPPWARAAFVACVGNHKEERCLPVLLEFAAASQPASVRTAAIEGLRDLLFQLGGTERQDIADAVAAAFDSKAVGLRNWALQTAFEVHAPLPLDALDDLLDDARRPWSDASIGDEALWILLDQLGMKLVDGDGKDVEPRVTDGVAACVRAWLREHQGHLRWSVAERRYHVAD